MSAQCSKLCSLIVRQHFGANAQSVVDALSVSICRTLPALVKSTNLPRSEVSLALAILIKFRVVKFAQSGSDVLAEYSLVHENILNMLRYSKYVHLIQTKYGSAETSVLEEVIRSGVQTASSSILKCFSNSDNKDKLETYRDAFFNLVNSHYIARIPVPKTESEEQSAVPVLQLEITDLFALPNIDLAQLMQIKAGNDVKTSDSGIFWTINTERFHRDFRDNVMIDAIERKLGSSAGECFKYILQQMYERTDPWQQAFSNPFTFVEIKQAVEKKSNNLDLIKYIDQYVVLIAEDSLGFIRKTGDSGGGQYVVDMKNAFEQLALGCTEHIIQEKFNSKTSRIFRVIKMKKFIEQEDLQKEAMVPAKEAKLLTYKLFEEQFIQIKTLRKAGGGGSGAAKAFYLFHIKPHQIMKMILDMSYKAFYNIITRGEHEKIKNKRLIDKSQKLESIVETMKERGESDEYIADILETLTPPEREILQKVKARIKMLSAAELALDGTIFLIQMYLHHSSQFITTLQK